MRVRQLLTHAFLSMVLVLAWGGTADAGKTGKLEVGGQTIGGPAEGSISTEGNMLTVFEAPSSGIDVCATVSNTSKGGLVDATLTSSSDSNTRSPNPGEVLTICLKDTETLKFTCVQTPCSFVYRVDKY